MINGLVSKKGWCAIDSFKVEEKCSLHMKLLKCYQDYLGREIIEDIFKKINLKNQAEELKTAKPAVTASVS